METKRNRITWLRAAVMLFLALFSTHAAWADDVIYTGFTATGGQHIKAEESYTKLVDGIWEDGNKWCCKMEDNPYVEFHADEPIFVAGYILTTGNDNSKFSGRNPQSWTLKAKLNKDDGWTTIATVEGDDTMEDENYKDYEFDLDVPGTYQYFRFDVQKNVNDGSVQLGELRFTSFSIPWKGEGGYCGHSSVNNGRNLYYEVSETPEKTLTIHKSPFAVGDDFRMADFSSSKTLTDIVSGIKVIVIEEGITSIGVWAFGWCSTLTSVTIPSTVTSIGERAFNSCSNLTSITIPAAVTLIGDYAFRSCINIEDVYCYADPTSLSWTGASSSFYQFYNKTLCHVFDAAAWVKKFGSTVNVTFVGDLTVRILDTADNTSTINTFDGKKNNVTLVNRILKKDGTWNALCVPFDVDLTAEGCPLVGATVKELDTSIGTHVHDTGFEDDTLYLNFKNATSIEAGKPYWVKMVVLQEDSKPTYTATGGTNGYASWPDFNYYQLIDGSLSNRWRPNFSGEPVYCEFKAAAPVYVTGYTLTSSNIRIENDPTMWTLQAKRNEGDAWTVIDSRNANKGDALPSKRTSEKTYTIQNQGIYQYFRFEVTHNGGGSQVCLTELTMRGSYVADMDDIESPTFKNVTIKKAAPTAVSSGDGTVTFTGSYDPVSIADGDRTMLFMGAPNVLNYPSAAMTLGSCRPYFRLNGIEASVPLSRWSDVNGDGSVNISDVTTLVNIILGKTDASVVGMADVNEDNDLNISDVTALVNAILGKATAPAASKMRVVVSDGMGIVYDGPLQ